jgi:ribosomal protein S18 acetylase RimI-like enzyme
MIKAVTHNELEVLLAISIQTFTETFAQQNTAENLNNYLQQNFTHEKIKQEFTDEKNQFFIIYINSEAAGYLKLRNSKNPTELNETSSIEIERIYVLKKYHGKKAGAQLMQKAIDCAVQKNKNAIWLGVWEHNLSAITFYTKWGFQIFGSHIFQFGNEKQTDLLMVKFI